MTRMTLIMITITTIPMSIHTDRDITIPIPMIIPTVTLTTMANPPVTATAIPMITSRPVK